MTPLERVKQMYDGFARGDFSPFMELMAEDVRWHVPGAGPFAGTTTSRDELVTRLLRQAEVSGGTALEWVDGMAAGALVAVAERLHARSGSGELEATAVVVLRFEGDHVVEAWDVFEDQRSYDEYWIRAVDDS